MSKYEYFTKEQEGAVVTVTFSRPEALNALSAALLKELDQIIEELSQQNDIRIVLFRGEGKAFIAGADIKEIRDIPEGVGSDFSAIGQNIFSRLEGCSFLSVAVVDGFALGGGCEFALACDIRVGTEKALMGLPEVSLGLIPGYGGTQRLPSLIGRGRALWMMASAAKIKGEDAYKMGLLDILFNHDALAEELSSFCRSILANSGHAVSQLKYALPRPGESRAEGFRREAQAFEHCCDSDDGKEGVLAFIEKRKPHFQS